MKRSNFLLSMFGLIPLSTGVIFSSDTFDSIDNTPKYLKGSLGEYVLNNFNQEDIDLIESTLSNEDLNIMLFSNSPLHILHLFLFRKKSECRYGTKEYVLIESFISRIKHTMYTDYENVFTKLHRKKQYPEYYD